MKITKAIIPAAGLGTRFLPYTKSVPKELVPLMGKPAIQLVVEEGIASGISEFEIIANNDKHAIIDYFSHNKHLDTILSSKNKKNLLESIDAVIAAASFNYIPQEKPLGLGHAILMAEKQINQQFFGIFLPDEIMIGTTPALAQLIAIAQEYNCSVIAIQEVPHDKVASYGIVATKQQLTNELFEVDYLVEKPPVDQAPSNLAIIGRYILSPLIFDSLKKISPGAGNEIQLTDGIAHMMNNGQRVLAYKVNTERYDIGNPLGWLQANIAYGLTNPFYAPDIKNYIKKIMVNNH